MLFTGKGDRGETGLYGCDQRVSKSSTIAEALGSLDEINSLLGFCKVRAADQKFVVKPLHQPVEKIIRQIQQDLFIVQAELAGAEKTLTAGKITTLETVVNAIEKELPPIHSFFISGGTELAATFDLARTVARRAERRVVQVAAEEKQKIGEFSRAYLNRLSSVLYALARYANFTAGVAEEPPNYD